MIRRYIKSGMILAACMFSSQAFAVLSINDAGVVGTIEQGTQNASAAYEIQWAQELLDMAINSTQTVDVDGNGKTENYATGSNDYSGTLTSAVKVDSGILTGWTDFEWVLGKYDGQNGGIVLFNVADYLAASGDMLPGTSEPIWTNNQGRGYQLSHWTGFNGTTDVPEPSMLLLLGAGLVGFGFIRRKKAA